jgi:hypothetical protein
MPIPPGFDQNVDLVTGSPITADDLNTAIGTRNAADYNFADVRFLGANKAALLFAKNPAAATVPTVLQRVSQLASPDQAAIDAEKAAQIIEGYWPTGVGSFPNEDLLVIYAQIDNSER